MIVVARSRVTSFARGSALFALQYCFKSIRLPCGSRTRASRSDTGGADEHRRASAAICRRIHLSFVRDDRDDVLCRSTAFRRFEKPGRAFQASSFPRAAIGGDEIRLRNCNSGESALADTLHVLCSRFPRGANHGSQERQQALHSPRSPNGLLRANWSRRNAGPDLTHTFRAVRSGSKGDVAR